MILGAVLLRFVPSFTLFGILVARQQEPEPGSPKDIVSKSY